MCIAVSYTHLDVYKRQPVTIEDLVDFLVGKVLDALDIEHGLFRRYGEL